MQTVPTVPKAVQQLRHDARPHGHRDLHGQKDVPMSNKPMPSAAATIRLTCTDRQGNQVTAECQIARVKSMNDGGCRITLVRPGDGDDFPFMDIRTDAKGHIVPEQEGVFAVW